MVLVLLQKLTKEKEMDFDFLKRIGIIILWMDLVLEK